MDQTSKNKLQKGLMSIGAREAIKLISRNAGNPKFKILDVRTLPERRASHIPNSEHVPLNELPQHLSEMEKDSTYLVYCHLGVRSMHAANFMNDRGYKAINMQGGILAWSQYSQENEAFN